MTKNASMLDGLSPSARYGDSGLAEKIRRAWRTKFGPECACGRTMRFTKEARNSPDFASIDHIRPRALGGSGALRNLRVICAACNRALGARLSVSTMTADAHRAHNAHRQNGRNDLSH